MFDCFYVFQVYANDLDSEENGNISYYIERGDRQKQFSIDRKTGQIIVTAPLDREEVSIKYIIYYISLIKIFRYTLYFLS